MVHDDIVHNVKKALKEALKFGNAAADSFYRSKDCSVIKKSGVVDNSSMYSDVLLEGTGLDIKIMPGPVFSYEYEHPQDSSDLKISYEGGTIRFTSDLEGGSGIIGASRGLVCELRLQLPANIEGLRIGTLTGDIDLVGLVLKRLSLRSGSGDLKCYDIRVQNMELKTGSGDSRIKSGRIDYLEAVSGSGDMNINGEAGKIMLKSGSGDIKATLYIHYGESEIGSISGDVELNLEKSPITVEYKTVSGELKTDTKYVKEGSTKYIGSGKEGKIAVRTTSGDLEVNGLK
jgi:DUF4097 and DUF4098 domain-containing protein YvlB